MNGMYSTKRISVVIVTYNKKNDVLRLIESIKLLKYDFELLDIVVVDNCSDDGTFYSLSRLFSKEITIIRTKKNLGGSGGFMLGVDYAINKFNNDLVWILDDDVIVHENCLSELIKCIDYKRDVCIAGSTMCRIDDKERIIEIGGYVDWENVSIKHYFQNYNIHKTPNEIFEVEFCAATSMLFSAQLVKKIGFWRNVFIHFDDIEWCLRAKRNKFKVVVNPKSIIWHKSGDKKIISWVRYFDVRNFLFIYKKYRPDLFCRAKNKYIKLLIYFLFHGHIQTAKLILRAIRDCKDMPNVQRKDLKTEKYISIKNIKNRLSDNPSVFVISDFDSYFKLKNTKINKLLIGSKLFIYEKNGHDDNTEKINAIKVYLRKRPGWAYLVMFYFKLITIILLNKHDIYFDGKFEHRPMFPLPQKATYLYPDIEQCIIQ